MSRFSILSFGVVKVEGPSMEPALQSGDWLLVRWFPQADIAKTSQKHNGYRSRIGNIVVIEREVQPGIFYIKRVKMRQDSTVHSEGGKAPQINQYWVEGDNPDGTDSRTWGWLSQGEIRAKVLFRYRKAR